jgi:hypothetical protein
MAGNGRWTPQTTTGKNLAVLTRRHARRVARNTSPDTISIVSVWISAANTLAGATENG